MDQSFATSNLRRIWDSQTRRGHDLLRFYPEVREAFRKLRDRRKQIRATRASIPASAMINFSPATEIAGLKAKAELALTEALSTTSETLIAEVEGRRFQWGLRLGTVRGSRQLYEIPDEPTTYFADKQLQRSIAALLTGHVSSRQSIVAGLVESLGNELPKTVLRLDVASYYESVDHKILRRMLGASSLSPSSLRLIDDLLAETERIVGVPKGLPAGIGLSAKLAELYLSQLDHVLRDAPGVTYYARYVDDIILVKGSSDPDLDESAALIAWIESELAKLELTLNAGKQHVRRFDRTQNIAAFEFLGYSISYTRKQLKVELTAARYAALKRRIDLTIDTWDKADHANHARRRLLLDRLRFLAGNTRLSHNKRNAMVGIYFSNPHVSNPDLMSQLDDHLKARLATTTIPPAIASMVDQISFVEAFRARSVRRFALLRMKQLRGAWRGKA